MLKSPTTLEGFAALATQMAAARSEILALRDRPYEVDQFAERIAKLLEMHFLYFTKKPGVNQTAAASLLEVRKALNEALFKRENAFLSRMASKPDAATYIRAEHSMILNRFSRMHGVYRDDKKNELFLFSFLESSAENLNPYFMTWSAGDKSGRKMFERAHLGFLMDVFFLRWLRAQFANLFVASSPTEKKRRERQKLYPVYRTISELFKDPTYEAVFFEYLGSSGLSIVDEAQKPVPGKFNMKKLWGAIQVAIKINWIKEASQETYQTLFSERMGHKLDRSNFSKTTVWLKNNPFSSEVSDGLEQQMPRHRHNLIKL